MYGNDGNDDGGCAMKTLGLWKGLMAISSYLHCGDDCGG